MEPHFRKEFEKGMHTDDCYVAQYIEVAEESDLGMANRIRCKAYFIIASIRGTSQTSPLDGCRGVEHLAHNDWRQYGRWVLCGNQNCDWRQYGRWVDAATVREFFQKGINVFDDKCAMIDDDCTMILGKVRVTKKDRVMLHRLYIQLTCSEASAKLHGCCWEGDKVFINNPRTFKECFPSAFPSVIPSEILTEEDEYGEYGSKAVLRWALYQMRVRMGFEIDTQSDGSMKLMHPLFQQHLQLYHRIGATTVDSDYVFGELSVKREIVRTQLKQYMSGDESKDNEDKVQEEKEEARETVHGNSQKRSIDCSSCSKEKRRKLNIRKDQ